MLLSWDPAKSMALKHGMDKNILDKVQNHAQNDVSSKHYVKYAFLAEKREAMAEWNGILTRILEWSNFILLQNDSFFSTIHHLCNVKRYRIVILGILASNTRFEI